MPVGQLCSKCRELMNCRLLEAKIQRGEASKYPKFHFFSSELAAAESGLLAISKPIRQHIYFEGVKGDSSEETLFNWPKFETESLFFHLPPEELEASAKEGCHLCSLIFEAFDGVVHRKDRAKPGLRHIHSIPVLRGDASQRRLKGLVASRNVLRSAHMDGAFSRYEPDLLLSFVLFVSDLRYAPPLSCEQLRSAYYTLVDVGATLPHDPGEGVSSGVRPNTVERICTWMRECCDNQKGDHHPCRDTRSVSVDPEEGPTRLLQIRMDESGTTLRLRETASLRSDGLDITYATLSHRWGLLKVLCRLEQANYDDFMKDIPLDILPKTFRDAVNFTSEIGLSYLWIDALCIIQDSSKDWDEEAPRMAPIYANCRVNIAATASNNSEGGLLLQKNLLTAYTSPSSWFGSQDMDPVRIGFPVSQRSVRNTMLSSRAWCFQEYHLAPRTVHFAYEQIWWECCSKVRNEYCSDSTCDLVLETEKLEFNSWEAVIRQYTTRDITRQEDRLVAFSGVAEAWAQERAGFRRSDYMAGFWRGNIKSNLLWHESPWGRQFDGASDEESRSLDHDDAYHAPSWSWASAKMPFKWESGVLYGRREHPALEVVAAEIETATGNPFGRVLSGSITIKCDLVPVCLITSSKEGTDRLGSPILRIGQSPWQRDFSRKSLMTDTLGSTIRFPDDSCFDVHIDSSTSLLPESDVEGMFCPAVYQSYQKGPATLFCGLLLRRVRSKGGLYQRIGLLRIWLERWTWYYLIDKFDNEPRWRFGEYSLATDEYLSKNDDGWFTIEII